MNTKLFTILNSNSAVKVLLGNSPLRVYPFGRAPQNGAKPYAVYSVYNANPENYLGQVPDIDNKGTQIDIYADTAQSAESCFTAIRDALEPSAHMTSFSTVGVEENTNLYNVRMEFDFWESR